MRDIPRWENLGQHRLAAGTLTITADCRGSNGNRIRLWKTELQRLADQNRPRLDPGAYTVKPPRESVTTHLAH
jgi:hypothetical protein